MKINYYNYDDDIINYNIINKIIKKIIFNKNKKIYNYKFLKKNNL